MKGIFYSCSPEPTVQMESASPNECSIAVHDFLSHVNTNVSNGKSCQSIESTTKAS